ncbi:hypothetical protein [Saccharothrix stipae]
MREPLVPVDRVELVPGGVQATVYTDRVSTGGDREEEVWVLATRGLAALDAPEVVIAVRRDGPPPEQLFDLFRSIHDHATRGTTLASGGALEVRPGTFDLDPRISGFLCLPYRAHDPRLPVIEGHGRTPLLLVPLLDGEYEAAERYGHLRVLALLGKLTRVFPHPWWFDSRRPVVIEPEPTHPGAATLLSRYDLPTAHVPYLNVVHVGPQVRLSLSEGDCARLHALLSGAPDTLLLLPGPGESEDARFVWRAGQTGPEAIMFATDDSVVHGDLVIGVNFLVLLHGDIEVGAVQEEDGYTLMMPAELWRRFLDALADRREFTWRASGREMVLEPYPQRYVSPFGVVIESPDGYPPYRPKPRARERNGLTVPLYNIRLDAIHLLTDQHVMEREVSADEVVRFIQDACQVVDDALDGVPHRLQAMLLHFRLAPGAPSWIGLAVRPDESEVLPQDLADHVLARLNALPAPAVRHHEVRFEARLDVVRD